MGVWFPSGDGWDAGWHLGLLLGGLPAVEMHFFGLSFVDNPGFAGRNVAFDGACAGAGFPLRADNA